ncbi:hypothetical protein CIB84_013464, partial [Bambusicola thoracicus]
MAVMKTMKMIPEVPFRHPFVPAGCAVHLPSVTNKRVHSNGLAKNDSVATAFSWECLAAFKLLLPQAPMAVALILVPPPSLSLHPSQGVSLGDNVSLRCHLPQPATWVWLYQDGGWTYSKYKEKENDTAEFSFVTAKWEHAGMYRCQYRMHWLSVLFRTSETSDPVELVVTGEGTGDGCWFRTVLTEPHPIPVLSPHADHRYPSPCISLSPDDLMGTGTKFAVHVEMGANVTIQCWNTGYRGTVLLHKRGHSAPVQRQDYSGVGTATFSLLAVTLSDAGTYGCSYRPKSRPFVSSALGDSVTLEVTPTAAPS